MSICQEWILTTVGCAPGQVGVEASLTEHQGRRDLGVWPYGVGETSASRGVT